MSYIGAATNVVGGIMQSIAASLENKAMMQAFNQELQRQLGFQAQGYGAWMSGLPGQSAETASSDINTGAEKAQGMYSKMNAMPLLAGSGASGPGSGAYASTDKAALGQESAVRSRLSGMSDWQMAKMINDIKTQDQINRINFRSQGDAQVFPYQMYNAQHSQDELDFWGKTISSIGGGGAGLSTSSPPTSMTSYSGAGGTPGAWSYGGIANPNLLDGGTGMYMPQQGMTMPSMAQQLPTTGFA